MENILGQRMKQLREQSQLSQKHLAEKLGMTNVQLSRYETGQRQPDPQTILRFADFFNVSVDSLFGREFSVHDPQAAYIARQDKALLEHLKQHPALLQTIYDIAYASDQKRNTFIKMWELFKSEDS